MSLIFGRRPQSYTDHRLAGMRVPTSIFGKPMALVYGTNRVAWNLIWYGDFKALKATTGGKGLLGGKSGTNYVYYASVAAMLAIGPIQGIGKIFSSQGALLLLKTTVQFTVPGGGGTFTPTPPASGSYYADLGVSRADGYSQTVNDYGSGGNATLSGTQQTRMVKAPSAAGAGQYSLSGSTYTFPAADAGKVMSISYTFQIPDSGTGAKGDPATVLALTLFTGTQGQAAWGYLTSAHPGQDLGYTLAAYVASQNLYLGPSGELQAFTFEIAGKLLFGGNSFDANPRDVLVDLLTDPNYGLGWSPALLDTTNALPYSQRFTQSPWLAQGGGGGAAPTVTDNATTAPDGTTTAASVVLPTLTGSQFADLTQYTAIPAAAAGTWTFSVWLKCASGTQAVVLVLQNTVTYDSYFGTTCNLTTNWQRFTVTGTFNKPTDAGIIQAVIRGTSATSGITFYVWGAQLENHPLTLVNVGIAPAGTSGWFVNQATSTANALTDPTGNQGAAKVVGTGTDGYVSITSYDVVPGATYTFSVWMRAPAPVTTRIVLQDSTGGVGGGTTFTPVNLTTAWQLVTVTRTPVAGVNQINCYVGSTGTIGTGVEFDYWGPILEGGPLPSNYYPTLDVAAVLQPFSDYCIANGLFVSPVLDSQEDVASFIGRLMQICNSEAVWSGNILKLLPYGDTTIVGNGVTFSPITTPVYDINDNDYSASQKTDPIQVSIPSEIDAFNDVKVEYIERSNAYNSEIVEAKDDGAIQQYGIRTMNTLSFREITTQAVATLVATAVLRRSVYIRRQYKFKLRSIFYDVEPMDLLTVTDPVIGTSIPVRVLSIEEDENRELTVTAEEFPWGTASSTLYQRQISSGAKPSSQDQPGSVNAPFIYEAISRASGQVGYQLWFGVSGKLLSKWGGCHVWMSEDGTNYVQVRDINGRTSIDAPARMGVLSATFAAGTDPDGVNTCSVDLSQSGGTLTSGTVFDADADRTLCLVDAELIAFSTATLTGPNQYNLTTYIRRGQMTTNIVGHSAGALFMRIDDAIFKWAFDATMLTKTLHFKFTSFNVSRNYEQSLADAVDYTIVPGGAGTLGVLTPAHTSYRPLSNPLTAHDAGSSATINIASFTMRVAGQDITEPSSSFGGLTYNTLYYIYFDDPNFTGGGAITYHVTTTKETALSVAGRFFVGSILTPKAGAPDTIGNNDGGSGAQSGQLTVIGFIEESDLRTQIGNGAVSNPWNMVDGDLTSFGALLVNGNGALNKASVMLHPSAGLAQRYQNATLKVNLAVPTNSLSGGTDAFSVAVSYTLLYDQGAATTILSLGPGATASRQTYSASLPPNINLSQVSLSIQAACVTETAGALEVDVYEAWIEANG